MEKKEVAFVEMAKDPYYWILFFTFLLAFGCGAPLPTKAQEIVNAIDMD